MSYVLYLDPSIKDAWGMDVPAAKPDVSYLKLTMLKPEQLQSFDAQSFPIGGYTIVELHPAQWEHLPVKADRLSFVTSKSRFDNLAALKDRLQQVDVDITFDWDKRLSVAYYLKLFSYWQFCGVTHFSFYGLSDFDVWQRLQEQLNRQGYFFYDRYHACMPGSESRYQKHIAACGNVLALGGVSRWTEEGQMKTRAAKAKQWTILSANDQKIEETLLRLADRDGMAAAAFPLKGRAAAINAGLAVEENGQLHPTDKGLWDTVGLVRACTNLEAN